MKTLKNIDGKDVYVMDKNPNTFATVNTVKNWIQGFYDKFNTNSAADAFVGQLGDELKATTTQVATLSKTGQITSVADITSRTDIDPDTKEVLFKFIDAENQGIKSVYANDINRMSAVTNSVKFCSANGKQYTFTEDETDAKNNPEKILIKVDENSGKPKPVFSDIQIKDSDNFMRNEFRRRYDYKEDIKTTPQLDRNDPRPKTAAEIGFEQAKDEALIFGQKVGNFVSGENAEETQASADYFNTLPGVKAVKDEFTFDLTVTDKEGNLINRKFELDKNGGFKNAHNVGISIAKLLNIDKLPEEAVVKAMDDVLKKGKGPTGFSATSSTKEIVERDYGTDLGNYANEKLSTSIVEDNPEETVKKLKQSFGKLGYTFEGETRGITRDDVIQIKAPNGTMSEWINIDDLKNTNKIADFIKKNKDNNVIKASKLFQTAEEKAEEETAAAKKAGTGTIKGGKTR
jgi:hypothetical protein